LRLQRLYPGSKLKDGQILVPKPEGDYLEWATTLLTQLFA
jgi:transcription-repair coupling factor (superfamily II helicase)